LAILSYLLTSSMSVSTPLVPTSPLVIPGVVKDWAHKPSAAASVDLSDDDDGDDVPLRDRRQRDKASSSIENSFHRVRAPSPPSSVILLRTTTSPFLHPRVGMNSDPV
jgi:hypothetical protein